ncbi:fibronectin type III-like domain-contianing protein [Nonomuraea sp. NPDC003201]
MQVYVSKPEGALERPALELADFAKTGDLTAGACETVVLSIGPGALASYDPAGSAFVAQPGEYLVHVGSSVADVVLAGRLTLDSPVVVRQAASPLQETLTPRETRDPRIVQRQLAVPSEGQSLRRTGRNRGPVPAGDSATRCDDRPRPRGHHGRRRDRLFPRRGVRVPQDVPRARGAPG